MRTEKVSWVTHAGGAGRLIQIRGAHRHREGSDLIMFLGFRAIIVSFLFLIAIWRLIVIDRRSSLIRRTLLS